MEGIDETPPALVQGVQEEEDSDLPDELADMPPSPVLSNSSENAGERDKELKSKD